MWSWFVSDRICQVRKVTPMQGKPQVNGLKRDSRYHCLGSLVYHGLTQLLLPDFQLGGPLTKRMSLLTVQITTSCQV